jgi:hypothetical protein
MKRTDTQRPFIEKVATDNREYVQSLLDENRRLNATVLDLEVDRNRAKHALESALSELTSREKHLAAIEEESRHHSTRYAEVEQQNTNLANLYVASYQLNGTLHRERVLNAIKEIVINLIGSEELAIFEKTGETLTLIDSFGIDENALVPLPLDAPGMITRVAALGETFIAAQTLIAAEGREENLTACIPLKLDDDVIAVIAIFRLLPQKVALEPVDLELFELLASHGATALYCTRLVDGAAQ